MQHTVIAFFDTYPQAEAARDALVAAGIAHEDVSLKARCEPTYASDATPAVESEPAENEGLLASIERFFESLFVTAPPERETAQYAEAVRRGAVRSWSVSTRKPIYSRSKPGRRLKPWDRSTSRSARRPGARRSTKPRVRIRR